MYCLTGNNSILLHTVLLFDACVYVLYAFTFRYKWSRMLASLTISANIFLLFLLSIMDITGADVGWQWQVGGLAAGALIGSIDVIGSILLFSDMLMASLLMISTQIAVQYVPQMLETQYGLTQSAANTITLIFPLLVFYAVIWLVKCDAVRALFRCIALALLATAAYILYNVNLDPTATVCCDASGVCPVMPNTTDVAIFIALALLLVLAVLYEATKDSITWCRTHCCCCLKCSCGICGCFCSCCKPKEEAAKDVDTAIALDPNDDDEQDSDEQAAYTAATRPLLLRPAQYSKTGV